MIRIYSILYTFIMFLIITSLVINYIFRQRLDRIEKEIDEQLKNKSEVNQ